MAATPVAMPKLGMTMQEGRVVAWPVTLGSRVEKGQIVLVIESEKTEVEIEAPTSGIFRHVYVEPDTTVPCGTLLAAITNSVDEAFDADGFRAAHDRPAATAPIVVAAKSAPTSSRAPSASAAAVTPAARALAKQLSVELSQVGGSGPGRRVTREDVEAFAERRKHLTQVAAGVSLEVPSVGAGEPVVLLPGFGTDASSFARQTPALAEHFRVIGINPRGVGLSDAPAVDCYDLATMATDAAAVLDRPAHIVGASLGAAVAIELALQQPERVRSLTLITPFIETNPRLLRVIDAWWRLAREAGSDALARALLPWLFSPRLLGDDAAAERLVRGLAATVARVSADTLERYAAGMRAWSGSRRNALLKIAAPTLILCAADDLLTPGGEAVAAAIPSAAVRVLDGGHALALEASEDVTAAILAHLGTRGATST